MLEISIAVYAFSYVGMEFVWLYLFRDSLMEEIIRPVNWRGGIDTFFMVFVLIALPATLLAVLLVILRNRI